MRLRQPTAGLLTITTVTTALLLSGCFQQAPAPPPGNPATEVGANPPRTTTLPPGSGSMGMGANPTLSPPKGKPVEGGKFNKLFPGDETGYDVVYTQEKQGFAQAQLKRNGTPVADLSISDMVTNPSAINKYSSASQQISGYPTVAVGANGTATLVGSRFQVQVRTRPGQNFSAQERDQWIAKFKLAELARMGGN